MTRERRWLFQEEEPPAEPGRYGCPMLVRSRFVPTRTTDPMMRCSLGWALHNEREAARCTLVEVVADCWKGHPERAELVLLPIAIARGEVPETDPAVIKVAGD